MNSKKRKLKNKNTKAVLGYMGDLEKKEKTSF